MYKAVIIGAGNIGALKPDKFDSPTTKNILTHAHAVYDNPNIQLYGIIDKDKSKASKAAKKWNCEVFSSIKQIEEEIDIYYICVDTKRHKDVLLEVLQKKPKIVLCEKPFCDNLEEAEEIIYLYEKANIPIILNYNRRYDPVIKNFKYNMDNFGKAYGAVVTYTRGFVRDGSHAIDILRYFFGEFVDGMIFENDYINDFSKNDLTYAAYMNFEKCPHVFFRRVDGNKYDVFELDITFENYKIIFNDHYKYIEYYPVIHEKTYGDYKSLSGASNKIERTELENTLKYTTNEIVNYLENGKMFTCTANDAFQIHKIYDYLFNKMRKNNG